jgi:hypothetical protein
MKVLVSYILLLLLIGSLMAVCFLSAGCGPNPAEIAARADGDPAVIRARAEAAKIEAEAKLYKVHIDDHDGCSEQEYEQIKRRHWASILAGLMVMMLVAVGLVAMSGAAALSIVVFRLISRITYVKASDEKGRGAVRPEGIDDGELGEDGFPVYRWR